MKLECKCTQGEFYGCRNNFLCVLFSSCTYIPFIRLKALLNKFNYQKYTKEPVNYNTFYVIYSQHTFTNTLSILT